MNDRRAPPNGWTFLRVIGMVVGVIAMAGFGLCTIFGILIGGDLDNTGDVLPFVLVGAMLVALSFALVRAVLRRVRGERRP
jgi:hypothetical protein